MTQYTTFEIWVIIAVLGILTFLIRFSFLGLMGARQMPEWALRHLRYTPVAVLPGLVAPLVLASETGSAEPAKIVAACLTVLVGWWRGSVIAGAAAGAVSFIALTTFGL